MDFRQAEQAYRKLKAQYDAGQLTEDRMRAALSELMVQDDQGRWWVLGYETGTWYVHDGEKWIPGQPPETAAIGPTRTAAPPAPGQTAQPLPARSQPWPWIAAALAVVGIVAVVLLTRNPDGAGQVAVQGTATDDIAALTSAAADARAATASAATHQAEDTINLSAATRQAEETVAAEAATAEAATRQAADEEQRPLRIAYHSNQSGNHDIWIMNPDGSGQQRLVGSAYDEFPYAWSPGTRELLYTQGIPAAAGRTEREAFGLFLDTGESEVITSGLSNVAGADWSPNGRAVVVASNRRLTDSPEVICGIPVSSAARHDILLVGRGTRTMLVESGTTPGGFRMCGTQSPRWSPPAGGNYIAFAAMDRKPDGDYWNIYRVNTDGTGVCELAAAGNWQNETPAWSPGAGELLYTQGLPAAAGRTEREAFGLFLDTGESEVITSGLSNIAGADWSPDGRTVVVASNRRLTDSPEVICGIPVSSAARHDILLVGRGARTMLVESGTTPDGFRMCGTQSPRWSAAAGGNHIAFAAMDRKPEGDRWNIYRVNTDDGSLCELAAGGNWQNETPAWSPDGRWVVYISTRDSKTPGKYGLFVAPGTCNPGARPVAVVLSSDLDVRVPAWSPDGRQIAFSARNSNGYYDLYVVDVDAQGSPTGKPKQLTTTPSISESGPVWVY